VVSRIVISLTHYECLRKTDGKLQFSKSVKYNVESRTLKEIILHSNESA